MLVLEETADDVHVRGGDAVEDLAALDRDEGEGGVLAPVDLPDNHSHGNVLLLHPLLEQEAVHCS